jgi:hypothetical protein
MRLDVGEAGQRLGQPHADLHHNALKSYTVIKLNRYTVTAPNSSTEPKAYGDIRDRKV